ncbi:hypothetical protein CPB85DRAFT_1345502, partial [Mucidula mucida]
MPYPFGPSSNEHCSLPPQAGLPWGGWQPSHSMTRPYPDTSLWTAPSPLQPSPFLHNTPVPQPTFAQTSHPLPLSQAFLPSGSYSNNDYHATATSCPHTPN